MCGGGTHPGADKRGMLCRVVCCGVLMFFGMRPGADHKKAQQEKVNGAEERGGFWDNRFSKQDEHRTLLIKFCSLLVNSLYLQMRQKVC
jgi:hypothetical protein